MFCSREAINCLTTCFHFEDYYLHQDKMKAYSLIILFLCTCLYNTVNIMAEFKINVLNLDMESTICMRECFHIHLIEFA